jgi:DNA primase
MLGIKQAFLALDGDNAGREATRKIGQLFQKEGVEVRVVRLPKGSDPDSFLRQEGAEAFVKLLESSHDYVTFLIEQVSQQYSLDSPAGKNELIKEISQQIRSWDQPVMVHESLRQLARLTNTPEELIGVAQEYIPYVYIKKSGTLGTTKVDPDRILECDFLRWLLLLGESVPRCVELSRAHLTPERFQIEECRRFYDAYLERQAAGLSCGVMDLSVELEAETQGIVDELLPKKVSREKAEKLFIEALQHMLERNWMKERESIRTQLQQADLPDEEQLALLKQFTILAKSPPKVVL